MNLVSINLSLEGVLTEGPANNPLFALLFRDRQKEAKCFSSLKRVGAEFGFI